MNSNQYDKMAGVSKSVSVFFVFILNISFLFARIHHLHLEVNI